MKEIKHETFRSGTMGFERDFADFLISNNKDHWKAKKCTFFRDSDKLNSWAFCSFECGY